MTLGGDVANESKTDLEHLSVQCVFSCLYGESEEFVRELIFNFMAHTDNACHLIINLPQYLNHIREVDYPNARISFKKGGAQRSPWGHTLLGGHIENLRLAESIMPSFQYFITIASNSLFIRPFDLTSAKEQARMSTYASDEAGLKVDEMPEYWHWPNLKATGGLIDRLFDRWRIESYYTNTIEGLFSKKENWDLLADVFDDVRMYCYDLRAPLEEILPATVWRKFERRTYAVLCHLYWDRHHEGLFRTATLTDILFPDDLPAHVSMRKWFQRNSLSTETQAVSSKAGLLLIDAFKEARNPSRHIGLRSLLEGFDAQLASREISESIFSESEVGSATCASSAVSGHPSRLSRNCVELECVANREMIKLDHDLVDWKAEDRAPFLYMENTGERFSIRLEMRATRNIGRVLRIECGALASAQALSEAHTSHSAYCYFSVGNLLRGEAFLYADIQSEPAKLSQKIANRLTLFEREFRVLTPDQASIMPGGVKARYILQSEGPGAFIGFPIYVNSTVELQLDAVRLDSNYRGYRH